MKSMADDQIKCASQSYWGGGGGGGAGPPHAKALFATKLGMLGPAYKEGG